MKPSRLQDNRKLNDSKKKPTNPSKIVKKINFFNYLIPIMCLKKIEKLRYFYYFIEIYQKIFSVDYLLEIILKLNQAGNSLDKLKLIKFNQLEEIEKIFTDINKIYSNEPITRSPFISENSRNHLKIQNISSVQDAK